MVCFLDAQASWGCMVGEQVADSVALRGQEAFITSKAGEGIPGSATSEALGTVS